MVRNKRNRRKAAENGTRARLSNEGVPLGVAPAHHPPAGLEHTRVKDFSTNEVETVKIAWEYLSNK